MKKVFVHTFGCQMNVSDSQRMSEALRTAGYESTHDPAASDLIILNTCSIRERAEEKMLSALGRYRQVKMERGTLIGVGGCVAQQEKDKILQRVAYVDFVFGPDAVARLPEIVARVSEDRTRVNETAFVDSEEYVFPRAQADGAAGKATEFVTIMKGCDNVCSFCVVPHTRGREVSRPWTEVVDEVRSLVEVGVREVTLLGQNVNSYGGGIGFPELLRRVAHVEGIHRVRFTTSHPHDLSPELIDVFRQEAKVASHFHLPVQSGSDAVLRRMKRDYTVEEYLKRLSDLREARPDVAVTTDIIVGFPGETEADFEATLALTEGVQYDGQFSFVYSPRPKTVAAIKEPEWGKVPDDVKLLRLERLQALQKTISKSRNQRWVGQQVQVLVEGPSKTDPTRRFGRASQNTTVNFDGSARVGDLVQVTIERAGPSALSGRQLASS